MTKILDVLGVAAIVIGLFAVFYATLLVGSACGSYPSDNCSQK